MTTNATLRTGGVFSFSDAVGIRAQMGRVSGAKLGEHAPLPAWQRAFAGVNRRREDAEDRIGTKFLLDFENGVCMCSVSREWK